ncbi:DUF2007 domain-containing protein [Oceanospirillum linum]|uniref:RanBP2-type domain-containing protein n=1 Tax=Oceanospirillum linum TaxID=966 RepID=A0A1T1H7Y9_OCELI|nr:DUF2007 domain-containing protein [Oceanospirillum linum]OOV85958.1 hypothetical protein BTA35_0215725 [Oceanospirillum linum]SEG45101.1 Putative signal transducing protein [Oleiphilus messinensis]SMP34502.1 Putative signal transducing protein [Oceanospirillum linum]
MWNHWNTELTEHKWLKVYAARDILEAHNLKGMLLAMGIEAHLKGEGLVAGSGELPPAETEVTLWVSVDDFTPARNALENFEAPLGKPWRCNVCAEQNEASFEFCWNCQHSA